MPSTTPYQIGKRLEDYVVRRATEAGCDAWRIGGSKGARATDILVASEWTGILALNVKRGTWAGPTERLAMTPLYRHGILPLLVMANPVPGMVTVLYFRVVELDGRAGGVREDVPWSEGWLAK